MYYISISVFLMETFICFKIIYSLQHFKLHAKLDFLNTWLDILGLDMLGLDMLGLGKQLACRQACTPYWLHLRI